ncbi:ParB/RepB/Spo0J family partition protein [Streptomyces beigongshangae]|uniref:ParB/RepB/Spo0J family partition protein n=1 Tax=Streptomyces beigongshangae TaxID=2841597 RepID=UPI001C85A2E6|nr:ParB/RepB/Spo0J family partition protein [Streptomyces sp. REN17]
MSVADKLGTGSSFGQVPRGRSARGRAKAVTQGDVPAYELVRLHLDEVAPTPLNPRRNFGTDEDKTRFGEELRQAQLAACVAVTREAYLKLWPEQAERIGDVRHVLVNGERRFRSAVHVGLDALDFVVRNDLATSREQFINYLLKENLEREDFDVIERARGVQQLVDVCAEQSERGARSRAAEQLGKDRSWVTNQLSLLELPEELQAMLSAGTLPERDGRSLARHLKDHPDADAAALLDHLQQTKGSAARARQRDKAVQQATPQPQLVPKPASLLSVDNKLGAPKADAQESGTSPKLLSADNKPAGPVEARDKSIAVAEAPGASGGAAPAPAQSSAPLPSARTGPVSSPAEVAERQQESQPKKLPYDNPTFVAMHLEKKMEPAHYLEATQLMAARCWDKAGTEPSLGLLKGLLQEVAQRDPELLRSLLEQFTSQPSTP